MLTKVISNVHNCITKLQTFMVTGDNS